MNFRMMFVCITLVAGLICGDAQMAAAQRSTLYDNFETGKTDAANSVRTKSLEIRTDEESINKGKLLFEQWCKKCHNAYSTVAMKGPGLKGLFKRDLLPISKKPATAENVIDQISKPLKKMPSFGFLENEDKLNIIAFLNNI